MPAGCASLQSRVVTALLTVALGAGSMFGAEPTAVTDPLARVPEALLRADSDWYGLYIQDTKVGYLHRARRPIETDAGERLIELRDEFRLQAVVLGGERSTRMTDVMRFGVEPPHLLRSAESETLQNEDRRLVRVVADGEAGYRAEVCEGDECRPHALDLERYTLGEALAPEVWVLRRPAEGTQIDASSLLLSELRASRDRLTLRDYRTTVLDGLPVEFAEVAFEDAETGLAGDLMITLDGRWLAGTLSGTFEVRLEPHETAIQLDDTTDLFLSQAVSVDRPLGDPTDIGLLILAVDAEADLTLPSTATQSWSCPSDDACRLTLGAGSAVSGATPEEIAAASAVTLAFPADLPAVKALALQATQGTTTGRERVRRLTAWVAEFIEDSYSAEPLSISDLLDDPRGDCTEHTALFITLARALGLPAREVHGLLYIGDAGGGSEGGSFGGHAWAEVLIDGRWLEVDPTWNEIPPSVGHIRLGHRLGDAAARQAALAGKTLRVVEVE